MGVSWKPNQKQGYPRFNLPCRITCPWATPECRRTCYAHKSERCRPSTVLGRTRNLALSHSPLFVSLLCEEVQLKQPRIFRVHESGDFYSAKYFRAWCEIARRNPGTRFFGYTKGYLLFDRPRPTNLVLLASVYYDERRPIPKGVPRFYTVRKGEVGPGKHCPGHCDTCNLCPYAKANTVVWTEVH